MTGSHSANRKKKYFDVHKHKNVRVISVPQRYERGKSFFFSGEKNNSPSVKGLPCLAITHFFCLLCVIRKGREGGTRQDKLLYTRGASHIKSDLDDLYDHDFLHLPKKSQLPTDPPQRSCHDGELTDLLVFRKEESIRERAGEQHEAGKPAGEQVFRGGRVSSCSHLHLINI